MHIAGSLPRTLPVLSLKAPPLGGRSPASSRSQLGSQVEASAITLYKAVKGANDPFPAGPQLTGGGRGVLAGLQQVSHESAQGNLGGIFITPGEVGGREECHLETITLSSPSPGILSLEKLGNLDSPNLKTDHILFIDSPSDSPSFKIVLSWGHLPVLLSSVANSPNAILISPMNFPGILISSFYRCQH